MVPVIMRESACFQSVTGHHAAAEPLKYCITLQKYRITEKHIIVGGGF